LALTLLGRATSDSGRTNEPDPFPRKRYEASKAQPTLPVLRRLAIALGVSGDALLFDHNERGPGDDLRLHFEAVSRMSPEDQQVVRSLLGGMIRKHDARRFERGPDR
jgi:transcriptional regulator with XRE-family HTH domain